jgi:uncharacterized protein YrrD
VTIALFVELIQKLQNLRRGRFDPLYFLQRAGKIAAFEQFRGVLAMLMDERVRFLEESERVMANVSPTWQSGASH